MLSAEKLNKYLETLELSSNDQTLLERREEIKSAYRKLSIKWHPDKWFSKGFSSKEYKEAESNFKAISDAYQALMNNMVEKQTQPNEFSFSELHDRILFHCEAHWTKEEYNLAVENLGKPHILKNLAFLLKQNKLRPYFFTKSPDPLFWQVFENRGYLAHSDFNVLEPDGFIRRDLDVCLNVFNYIKINSVFDEYWDGDPRRNSFKDEEKLWLIMAARIANKTTTLYQESPYLNDLKWDLICGALPEYISSKGKTNRILLNNILNLFACSEDKDHGSYLHTIYEKFILPTQNKIIALKNKKDPLSHIKAEQLDTALKAINHNVRECIFEVTNQKNKKIKDFSSSKENIHYKIIGTINGLISSDEINSRVNIVRDVLRSTLGVFICAVSLGIPLVSKNFRMAFFHSDSRAKVEKAADYVQKSFLTTCK